MRWGEKLEFTAEAGPGDFIYVPPYVPVCCRLSSGEFEASGVFAGYGDADDLNSIKRSMLQRTRSSSACSCGATARRSRSIYLMLSLWRSRRQSSGLIQRIRRRGSSRRQDFKSQYVSLVFNTFIPCQYASMLDMNESTNQSDVHHQRLAKPNDRTGYAIQ